MKVGCRDGLQYYHCSSSSPIPLCPLRVSSSATVSRLSVRLRYRFAIVTLKHATQFLHFQLPGPLIKDRDEQAKDIEQLGCASISLQLIEHQMTGVT